MSRTRLTITLPPHSPSGQGDGVNCGDRDCTGVHDNNRYRELCPRVLAGKRERDDRYYCSDKGILARARKTRFYSHNPAAYAELCEFVTSGELDDLVKRSMESADPLGFMMRETFSRVFGGSLTSIVLP
jgi:hypothetical protein